MAHVGTHFLGNKSYSEPEHLMRKVFIEINVQPFDWPRGRTIIVLVDEEYAIPIIAIVLLVILNSLNLMLVVVWLCCHLVRKVGVHNTELGIVVFKALLLVKSLGVVFYHRAQSILALEYASLAILLVWVAFGAETTVLAIEKLVRKGFHEWTTLVKVEVENMVNVRADCYFVFDVVLVKSLAISLH